MQIKIYNEDRSSSYSLSVGKEKNNIWISKEDGEAGDFNMYEVSHMIYEAIDKFFKDNM